MRFALPVVTLASLTSSAYAFSANIVAIGGMFMNLLLIFVFKLLLNTPQHP